MEFTADETRTKTEASVLHAHLEAGFSEFVGLFVLEVFVVGVAEELEEERHDRVEVLPHAVAH
jgi:hypothetical protein